MEARINCLARRYDWGKRNERDSDEKEKKKTNKREKVEQKEDKEGKKRKVTSLSSQDIQGYSVASQGKNETYNSAGRIPLGI